VIGEVFSDGWTIRTRNGRGRATYHKGGQKPWRLFLDGTAHVEVATLAEARTWFGTECPLETEIERTARLNQHNAKVADK
jgi:hypothetical protein